MFLLYAKVIKNKRWCKLYHDIQRDMPYAFYAACHLDFIPALFMFYPVTAK